MNDKRLISDNQITHWQGRLTDEEKEELEKKDRPEVRQERAKD